MIRLPTTTSYHDECVKWLRGIWDVLVHSGIKLRTNIKVSSTGECCNN